MVLFLAFLLRHQQRRLSEKSGSNLFGNVDNGRPVTGPIWVSLLSDQTIRIKFRAIFLNKILIILTLL